ncbi:hypothetical protein [Halolamina sp. CBA1230]|uniref:hypothetical protein n=1 Tax=Halolamina sp. CBA1230 TaxID=1853690 RepID=UPI0020D13685|nr:hypothetical protein [Halolamina sp. CBA1230]
MSTVTLMLLRAVMVMRDGPADAGRPVTNEDPDAVSMTVAYRHDVHKLRGRTHAGAASEFRGIPVNQDVPLYADADAALLSRPRGEPEQTVPAHDSPRRLPLLDGEVTALEAVVGDIGDAIFDLVRIDDPAALHRAWLDASVPALFSESRYYPFTSAKYHTLLVAALLDNYRAVSPFGDVYLSVSTHAGEADPRIVPHRTVLTTASFALHVTADPVGPAARIGSRPTQCFGDVWARLPAVPFDVDARRCWRVLDGQLRRLRSWSTALQYIEAFCNTVGHDDAAATSTRWWA